MVAATLCGITDPRKVKRSVCAMGHKWLWNPKWGGFPPQAFLSKLDPLLDGIVDKLSGDYLTSDHLAGHLSEDWAAQLGLRAGIPIPVGAFDAHWDAIGAGCRTGDVVNVIGTSTCIIAMQPEISLIPGVCGVVPGSVHPAYAGVEAGLSATGDIFEAIARRAGTTVKSLAEGIENNRPGQTGLLRLTWDNGDRTVLVNADLAGITIGWNLLTTAQDELFAAIEGTAFHTRIILERMAEHRRSGRARRQRRWHPAEQRDAQPDLRERAQQAGRRSRRHPHQPGLGHLRHARGGNLQDGRRGAGQALPQISNLQSRARRSGDLRQALSPLSRSLLQLRRRRTRIRNHAGDLPPAARDCAPEPRTQNNFNQAAQAASQKQQQLERVCRSR